MTFLIYYNVPEVIILANKDLKTRTPVGSAIDTKILDELRAYSKESGIPLSKLLDKSIDLFLRSIKDK